MENNDDDPGGFRACLGIKLARTSTGAEVFVALKGAVDVGLNISYSEKRFPGYDSKAKSLKADGFRADIFRQYMADYMRNLFGEDEEAYKKQFSRHTKLDVTPDRVEGLYTRAHAAIRADPAAKAEAEKKVNKKKRTAAKIGLESRKAKVDATKFLGRAVAKYPERNVVRFLKKPATKVPKETSRQGPKESCYQVSRESCH